mmetsp:Transcript_24800/g.22018  ORF Transcript_24800/g.22018 Transcript_24800/m.22018 type:complete len:263 (-) Transcript_24800:592-1380(-)
MINFTGEVDKFYTASYPNKVFLLRSLSLGNFGTSATLIISADKEFWIIDMDLHKGTTLIYEVPDSQINFMIPIQELYLLGGKSSVSPYAQFNIIFREFTSSDNKMEFNLMNMNFTENISMQGAILEVEDLSISEYEIHKVDLQNMVSIDIGDYITYKDESYFQPIVLNISSVQRNIIEKKFGTYDFPKVCFIDPAQTVTYRLDHFSTIYTVPSWVSYNSTSELIIFNSPEAKNRIDFYKFTLNVLSDEEISASYTINFNVEK